MLLKSKIIISGFISVGYAVGLFELRISKKTILF
jgi:hypothetical protein